MNSCDPVTYGTTLTENRLSPISDCTVNELPKILSFLSSDCPSNEVKIAKEVSIPGERKI